MTESGKSVGGRARAEALTPEQRSAAAKKAAAARWTAREVPKVISGSPDKTLHIGDAEIECYVLEDGTRVLTQGSMLTTMGRSRRLAGRSESADDLPPLLQSKSIRPYLDDELIAEATPIPFRLPNGVRASGYRAELLPKLCEVYLAARSDDALPSNQLNIARAAEVLVRALAHVGITALVDEATGYQDIRAKDALAQVLEAFVAKELQPWVKTFPVDFYREMFRLRGLDFSVDSVKRPGYFGHLTNNVVYKRLAPGVLDELKRQKAKDEKPKRGKLHQRLSPDIGHPKLREHLASVTTVMKLSDDWDGFISNLDRVHPIIDPTMPPALWEDDSGTGL